MRMFIYLCVIHLFVIGFSVNAYSTSNYIDVTTSSALSAGTTIPSESLMPLINDAAMRSATNTLNSLSGFDTLFTPTAQTGLLQPANWPITPTTTSSIPNAMDGLVRSVSGLDTINPTLTSSIPTFTDSYGLTSVSNSAFSTTGVRSGLSTPTNMAFTTMPVQSENLLPSGASVVPRAGALPTAVAPTWNTMGPTTQSVSVTTPSITLRTVKTSVLPSIVQADTAYHSNVVHKPKIITPIVQKIFVPIKVPIYKPKPKMMKHFRMKKSFRNYGQKFITIPIGGPHDNYRQSYYGPYFGPASEFSFHYGPHQKKHLPPPIRKRRFEPMRRLSDFDDEWEDF